MEFNKSLVFAAAVTGLLGTACTAPVDGNNTGETTQSVKCTGIHECAGNSECAGNGNESCQGTNECAAYGWVSADSEQDCVDKGGEVLNEDA